MDEGWMDGRDCHAPGPESSFKGSAHHFGLHGPQSDTKQTFQDIQQGSSFTYTCLHSVAIQDLN
eukprot:1157488-Pelagomonas_calceolata.AAC.6